MQPGSPLNRNTGCGTRMGSSNFLCICLVSLNWRFDECPCSATIDSLAQLQFSGGLVCEKIAALITSCVRWTDILCRG